MESSHGFKSWDLERFSQSWNNCLRQCCPPVVPVAIIHLFCKIAILFKVAGFQAENESGVTRAARLF